jgi:hypothetical protein
MNSDRSLRPRIEKKLTEKQSGYKIYKKRQYGDSNSKDWTKTWSDEEDNMLVKLCKSKLAGKWTSIAKIISSKSPSQCIYRYSKLKFSKKELFIKRKGEGDILFSDKVKKALNDRTRLRLRKPTEDEIDRNKLENKNVKEVTKPNKEVSNITISSFINSKAGASKEFNHFRRSSGISKFDQCEESNVYSTLNNEIKLDDPIGKLF